MSAFYATVVAAGTTRGGYGTFVILQYSEGVTTLYGHLQLALVHEGEAVVAGQPIDQAPYILGGRSSPDGAGSVRRGRAR